MYVYIYIYMERERERKRDSLYLWGHAQTSSPNNAIPHLNRLGQVDAHLSLRISEVPDVHTGNYKNFLDITMHAIYIGVSKNRGTPKWMVYNGKFC